MENEFGCEEEYVCFLVTLMFVLAYICGCSFAQMFYRYHYFMMVVDIGYMYGSLEVFQVFCDAGYHVFTDYFIIL